jgi:lipopolysaccharide export system permease protein
MEETIVYRLDQYLGTRVALGIVLVLFLFVGLDALFGLMAELENFRQDYGFSEALIYTLRTLPRRIYEALPIGVLIGSLMALGTLASGHELVAIQAAGWSRARIIGSALIPVTILSLAGLGLAQWVVPKTESHAQNERSYQRYGVGLDLGYGYWFKQTIEDQTEIVHIHRVLEDQTLANITRLGLDKNFKLTYQTQADQAILKGFNVAGFFEWSLINDEKIEFHPDQLIRTQTAQAPWQTRLSPEVLNWSAARPDFLSLSDLYLYRQFLAQQDLSFDAYDLAFWQKILQPVGSILMLFLSAGFIFGPLRSVPVGARLMSGLIVGLGFQYLKDIFGFFALVYGLSAWLAAALPLILLAVLAFWLTAKKR